MLCFTFSVTVPLIGERLVHERETWIIWVTKERSNLKLNYTHKSISIKTDSRSRFLNASIFQRKSVPLLSCFVDLGCNSLTQKTLNNRSKCWIETGNLESQWTYLPLLSLGFHSKLGESPDKLQLFWDTDDTFQQNHDFIQKFAVYIWLEKRRYICVCVG